MCSLEGRSDRRTSYDTTENLKFIRYYGHHTTLNRTHLNFKNKTLTNLSSFHMGSYELMKVTESRACMDTRHRWVLQSLRHAVNQIIILQVELIGCERKTQKNDAHCKQSSRLSGGKTLRCKTQASSSAIDNMTS